MPFKRGISGNPGGRPSVPAEVRDLARQRSKEAVELKDASLRHDTLFPISRHRMMNIRSPAVQPHVRLCAATRRYASLVGGDKEARAHYCWGA
jgi:hypothetical protein